MKLKDALKDTFSYLKMVRTIRKIRKTPDWKEHKLRHDWIYRIYTVLNLEAEDFNKENIQFIEARVLEKMAPVGMYLQLQNLGDYLVPELDRVRTSTRDRDGFEHIEYDNAYLLIFHYIPVTENLTLPKFIRFAIFRLTLLISAIYLCIQFDIINHIQKFFAGF